MTPEERIRERAHRIWEEEGRPQGRERDHWERARREIAGQSAGGSPLAAPDSGGPYATGAEDLNVSGKLDDRKDSRPATLPGGSKLAGS